MKFFIVLILILLNLTASQKSDALSYLNSLRNSAGLSSLNNNKILEEASQNHSNYINDIWTRFSINLMHKEDKDIYPSSYYTGKTSKKRGVYSGYKSLYYFENLSAGHKNIYASIDSLMGAIYHRYEFLRNNIDEIGIGINKSKKGYLVYTYNMGNSILNILCQGDSFGGKGKYVYKACAKEKLRLEKTLYLNTKDHLSQNSPQYVIWPPKNGKNIPTVFFEEFPDPLPEISVSGYPISIEFNSYYYDNQDIEIKDFKLFDSNNNEILDTLLMDYSNDPNDKHTRFQFTLFPKKRLHWNQKYKVFINYYVDNNLKTITWNFLTKKLNYPYYTIKEINSTIKLKTNTYYILYMEPLHNNDIFKSWRCTRKIEAKASIKSIDKNTLLVKFDSKIGDKYHIKLSNSKKITIQIALEDNAVRQ